MIGTNPMAYAMVHGFVYGVFQTAVVVMVCRDMWRERWNGKFRGIDDDFENLPPDKYHETDYRAFVANLTDESVPQVSWPRVFAAPLVAATLVTITFWALYWMAVLLV